MVSLGTIPSHTCKRLPQKQFHPPFTPSLQVVRMNPYAALCSHMLSEAIDKLRRGEQIWPPPGIVWTSLSRSRAMRQNNYREWSKSTSTELNGMTNLKNCAWYLNMVGAVSRPSNIQKWGHKRQGFTWEDNKVHKANAQSAGLWPPRCRLKSINH